MAVYRVNIRRVQYLEAEIDADSVEEARELAQSSGHDWRDATGGRGLGDDDVEVLDVEDISDEYESEDESGDESER
jgi:hypothetical protein